VFDGQFRTAVDRGVAPVGQALRRMGVTPDLLTALGLLLAVAAAVTIASGQLFWGLLLVIGAALPDLLDGAVAKAANTSSPRGAFFDSVSDRVTDALLLGGVAWHLAVHESPRLGMLAMAVMGTSSLISYQRAKAESLGYQAKGGLMERAERVIVLCVGLAFPVLLVPALWVLLVGTSVTAVQRFVLVWRQATAAQPVFHRSPPAWRVNRARRQSRVVRAEARRRRIEERQRRRGDGRRR
jgi:CDP-diacylglycerol--glycerol-3-phosphate 3-phosphatidyltransferase